MKHASQIGIAIFWFRRDLRLEDNAALHHALSSGLQVLPVFIFDTEILDALHDRADRRVLFIHREVSRLKAELEQRYGSTLHAVHGSPRKVFQKLMEEYQPTAVFANEDYEPYARARDKEINDLLSKVGSTLHLYKDHVVFAKDEIVKRDGKPYTVFTPYRKQWLASLKEEHIHEYTIGEAAGSFVKSSPAHMPSLAELGFLEIISIRFPAKQATESLLREYGEKRDFPAKGATSHLGVHLRFGTISARALVRQARDTSPTFLNELIWREFFQQILWHFPHVVDTSFKVQYDDIDWRNDETEYEAWCSGMTGYPLVDAGMRELNETGFMHNRVRMVVASFLTKHLLIDWRWGEAWFADKLLDYELASNNGNWQWAAGTGCDAAPYFRIFNPMEQARKFDPDSDYVHAWVPEIGTSSYPQPIVDHQFARQRALGAFKEALRQRA